MKKYVFKTHYMTSAIVINADNLNYAKLVIKNYLCVNKLPKGTTIAEYLF